MLYDFQPEFTGWSDNVDSSIGPMTTVFPSSANTYTSYSTVISSTPFDAYGITIFPASNNTAARQLYSTMGQIATGAAGSEVNLIEGLCFLQVKIDQGLMGADRQTYFPLYIPAGTRLSFRGKTNLISDSQISLLISLNRQTNYPFNSWFGTKVTTYGINDSTLNSSVIITPGAGVSVWSSWTTVVSSTTRHHSAMVFDLFAQQTQTFEYIGYSAQFAIGAAGSEKIISPVVRLSAAPEHTHNLMKRPTINNTTYWSIPAGSRISARVMSDGSSERRDIGVACYGIS